MTSSEISYTEAQSNLGDRQRAITSGRLLVLSEVEVRQRFAQDLSKIIHSLT